MVNIRVSKKRTVRIAANATAGVIDTTTPVVIKNNPVISGGVSRLDRLTDVAANTEVNGATLVYNAANDTYVVQKLDLSNVTGDLDGGNF